MNSILINISLIYWISTSLSLFLSVVFLSQGLKNENYFLTCLKKGFYIQREGADEEWSNFKTSMYKCLLPWFICHSVFSLLLNKFSKSIKLKISFYIGFGIIFALKLLGINCTVIIIMMILFSMLIRYTGSSYNFLFAWVVATIYLINGFLTSKFSNREKYYKVLEMNSLFHTLLRCVYYSVEKREAFLKLDEEKLSRNGHKHYRNSEVTNLFLYVFYTPLLVYGQLLPFTTFIKEIEIHMSSTVNSKDSVHLKQNKSSIKNFYFHKIIHFFKRIFLGTVFLEMCGHLVYPYTVLKFEDLPWHISTFNLAGLLYLVSQFFTIKYIVLWSFTSAFACFDGIKTPSLPKCTSCFYYVSDVWRQFDVGLYEFIKRNIYLPMGGRANKFKSSILSFMFLFMWHGVSFRSIFWISICLFTFLFERFFLEKYRPHFYIGRLMLMLVNVILFLAGIITFFTNMNVCQAFFYKTFIEGFPNKTFMLLATLTCILIVGETHKDGKKLF